MNAVKNKIFGMHNHNRIATFLAYIIYIMCTTLAPLTAHAQDNFAQTYTWSDGNPPTIPESDRGGYGNGKFLITLSGSPSGTLETHGNSITIRGTVTGYQNYMDIYGNTDIIWEANLSAVLNSNTIGGVVKVTTNGFLNPPDFEVKGSITNSGAVPALYNTFSNVIVSGNGIVRNEGIKLVGSSEQRYAAITSRSHVTVKDNAQVVATGGGSAIIAYDMDPLDGVGWVTSVTISGGLVFGAGEAITGAVNSNSVIQLGSSAVFNSPTGTGTIIGWNKSAGRTAYPTNGTTDIVTLPAGTTAAWTTQSSQAGISWQNGTASGFIPIAGITFDNIVPTVNSVTPTGTETPRSGNVVITFSEAMDTRIAGTVQLNSLDALAAGVWSNGNTVYTAGYRRLAANTAHTVKISGFRDVAGNPINAVTSGYTFTTDNTTLPNISVTNTNDSGEGSLRSALAAADDGDVIDCSLIAGGTILLTSALNIARNITIEGYGIKLDGGGSTSQMQIGGQAANSDHPSVNLRRIHFANGGGLRNYATALNVQSCIFSNNSAVNGGAFYSAWGNAYIYGCTFYNNSVSQYGGAIFLDINSNANAAGASPYINLTGNVFYGNYSQLTGYNSGNVIYKVSSSPSPNSMSSGGYNIVDKSLSTEGGSIDNFGFSFNGTGDAQDATLRFNTTTFRPTGTQLNIVASGISGFPTTDFYGTARAASSGTAGAVQRTTETSAPTLSAGNLVARTSHKAATIGFNTNEAGTAYYLAVESGTSPAPTNTAVKAANNPLGTVSGTVSGKAVTLTRGAKDIYVVVEDAAGNISNTLKITAAAY
ncbi:hypothetical protein FACS1894174_04600 [Bacteroidia bacterium]|nr:hypothetical protein FACS1894174_04600 [Bacteroidia bacterium]